MSTNKVIEFPNIKCLPPKDDASEEEDKQINNAFKKMVRAIKGELTEQEQYNIERAYHFARRAHWKQRRKSGELYIFHPIEVARICAAELGLGDTSVIAALLHDTVEDTDVTQEDLKNEFGEQVAEIVNGLTKFDQITNVSDSMRSSPQAENFKKVLLTISKDVRVVLIKIADRLHNMRTIDSMKPEKQLKIASETTYIYAPLAHRLGFYNIKSELEDHCLRVTEPESYGNIAKQLQATEADRNAYIDEFIKPLRKALKKENFDFEIFGRVKSVSSINNKLKKKQVPLEEIYDLFAIRVILDVPKEREKSACWNTYSVVTDYYTPVPERLKDWISTPKSNGYESLHTTVMGPKGRFVEVQIRSKRMDEIAELGYAAHWKYKGIGQQGAIFENWLNKAREILENPSSDAIDFLNDFKSNLFTEEVYVFTPKGDMRFFPKGATALDFAFEIHTEVGYHCKAVKLDQRIVPLSYELQNGDQLSVITSNSQKPTEDWLKIVKTGKAKNKIRQALKDEKIRQGSMGKETLERKLRALKAWSEDNIDFLVKYYGMEGRLEFFYAIFEEQIDLTELKGIKIDQNGRFYAEKEKTPEQLRQEEKRQETSLYLSQQADLLSGQRQFKGKPKLMIDGEDAGKYSYSLSTCCNPVLGDPIFAFVSSGQGIKIHRNTCPNAEFLHANFGYRIKKAEWVDTGSSSFVAELLITGMDDMGVVQKLSDVIANQLAINMRAFSMTGNDGHFEGKISVLVKNKDQLNQLIMELKKLEMVNTVARIE